LIDSYKIGCGKKIREPKKERTPLSEVLKRIPPSQHSFVIESLKATDITDLSKAKPAELREEVIRRKEQTRVKVKRWRKKKRLEKKRLEKRPVQVTSEPSAAPSYPPEIKKDLQEIDRTEKVTTTDPMELRRIEIAQAVYGLKL
jgi:hypothetical protein